MSQTLTETSDSNFWEAQEWKLMPFHFPVAVVDIPDACVDLRNSEAKESALGGYIFVWSRRKRNIDALTHQTLLEVSIREFSDIWRTLAEK